MRFVLTLLEFDYPQTTGKHPLISRRKTPSEELWIWWNCGKERIKFWDVPVFYQDEWTRMNKWRSGMSRFLAIGVLKSIFVIENSSGQNGFRWHSTEEELWQWKTMNFNDFHIRITSLWVVPDRSGNYCDSLLYPLITCPVLWEFEFPDTEEEDSTATLDSPHQEQLIFIHNPPQRWRQIAVNNNAINLICAI